MSDTVMRYIAMLKYLPRLMDGVSATELHTKLRDLGYAIDRRSVERDLHALSAAFPITNDEGRPARWYWMRDAPFTSLPSMDPITALTLELVSRFLKPLMPPRALKPLDPQIKAARLVLAEAKTSGIGRWADRIVVVPQGQPLAPPVVPADVTEVVYEALLSGRRFEVSYRAAEAERPKRYPVSPLGLVVRGNAIYLVGTARDYTDPCVYALHRMSRAVALDEPVTPLRDFDLQAFVQRERLFEFPLGGTVKLELRASPFLANQLSESRLSADQQITQIAGSDWSRIVASVTDTEQLLWWLLGLGARVVVEQPLSLRKRVAAEVVALGHLY